MYSTVRVVPPGSSHPGSARRFALVALSVIALVLGFTLPSAFAASGPYTIDGSVPDSGAAEVTDIFGSTKELGPLNSNTTKIGVIHNDAVPTLGMTNPNAQVDLRRSWLKLIRHTDNNDWLYFAWERDSNTGSGFIAYEFMAKAAPEECAYDTATNAALIADCNPWENRDAGDFMILWDQQGGSRVLTVRQWTGTKPNLTLNTFTLDPSLYEAQYSPDGFRGEAAINLTDAVPGSSTGCRTIANTIPSTVTGNSDTADYKDTILTRLSLSTCSGDVVTTPQTAAGDVIGSAGVPISATDGFVAVRDEAKITVTGGSPDPAGSVSFWLCKLDSGTCATGGTAIGGAVNVTDPAYPARVNSPTAYVTSAGRYCWRATWTGDAANDLPPDTDSSAGECFTVTPVTPTLSTEASADVTLGNTVSDTATLSGTAPQPTAAIIHTASMKGADAGGSITFKLYGPQPSAGVCGPLVYTSPTPVAVSGDDDYTSGTFTPTVAGTYSWVAEYSGNSPNTNGVTHNADCKDTDEDVEVTSVPSSLTSAQSFYPNDSVTVSATAGGTMAGTVSFAAYESADCTGTAIYSTTANVAGASPVKVDTNNTTVSTTAANVSWKVSFDSTNSAQRDIGDTCHEKTALTITNGGTITSP